MAVAGTQPQLRPRAVAQRASPRAPAGRSRSSPPCTSRTGASIRATSNPHGATKATSSSIRPSSPARPARPASSPSEAHARDRAAQSAAVKLSGSNSSDAACRARASRPSTAAAQAAGGDHPGEPVDVRGDRRQARQAGRARDPRAQQGGAGERVRAAAGRAHDREPPHPERVGQLRHVGRRGRHVAPRARARTAVARPAVGQQPDAALRGRRHQRRERGAGLRRAVVPHDRERAVASGGRVVHPQDTAVCEPYVAL